MRAHYKVLYRLFQWLLYVKLDPMPKLTAPASFVSKCAPRRVRNWPGAQVWAVWGCGMGALGAFKGLGI